MLAKTEFETFSVLSRTNDARCMLSRVVFRPSCLVVLQDLRGSVVRISQFLGKDLDDAAIESVVANASFESMKSNKMSNFSLTPKFIMNQKKSAFLRKGDEGMERGRICHLEQPQSG